MWAFLDIIPSKWIWTAAAIGAVFAGFAFYANHERTVGAAHEKAVVAAAVAKEFESITKAVNHADSEIAKAAEDAAAITSSPPAADSPHVIVRYKTITAACPVQAPAGPEPAADAATNSAKADSRDIGPPLDTAGRDADAEIAYLQAYIRACQDVGYCSK